MAVNPKNFLLNTDYDMDKIILVKTGSTIGNKDISHDLGFAPLPFGVWSTDSNFSTVNSIGVTDSGTGPGYVPRLGVDCESLSDKIRLLVSGDGSDTTTIYYRLYGFAKPGDNVSAASTSSLANKFILNTDYNYRKIMATGEFTQNYQEYTHNLGYIPQVMAWYDLSESPLFQNRGIFPLLFFSKYTDTGITVTTNKIQVARLFQGEKVYWRIYYDEA